jgi:murein DD-endopeptidase MepM/ murein hydrolase activator NlpD
MELLVILMKVRGEDASLDKSGKSRLYMSIIVIAATLTMSSICYAQFMPNAYEVTVGNKIVAYIKYTKENFQLVQTIGEELGGKFNSSDIKACIATSKAQVPKDYFIEEKLLEKAIVQNSNLQVEALSMKSDGKELGVVSTFEVGNKVLEKVKDYYISKCGVKVSESKIKSKITYIKQKVMLSEVESADKVAERIKEVNEKAKVPVVVFEFKGNTEAEEVITPTTTVKSTNELKVGESKVQSQGKEGKKLVVREVIFENTNKVSTKTVSEQVMVPSQNKIILRGTKSVSQSAAGVFLATPSRGAVSSSFGARWGRMHEGMDIAASLGSPIVAALEGTVTFAGWVDGYGKLIKLKHDKGIETYYGHCSKILVSEGQKVKKGAKIGLVGSTGRSTGPHLHFEVRVNGVPKNPANYLK